MKQRKRRVLGSNMYTSCQYGVVLLLAGYIVASPRVVHAEEELCKSLGRTPERAAIIKALRKSRAQRANAETALKEAFARQSGQIANSRTDLADATTDFGVCIDKVGDAIESRRKRFDTTDQVLAACSSGPSGTGCGPLARLRVFSEEAKELRHAAEAGAEFERALAADSSADGDTAGGRSAYFDARALREDAERKTEELRVLAEVAMARYRLAIAGNSDTATGDFDPRTDPELARLLGPRGDEFLTQSVAAQTQLKAVGGASVPAPVSELFSVATSVALKKAKRNGLALLQQELRARVCSLQDPAGPTALFPETCRLLEGSSLEQIATDPRVVQPGLTADLMALGSRKLQATILANGAPNERMVLVGETLKLTLTLAGRVRSEQLPVPAAADGRAIVQALAKLRTMEGWGVNLQVPIAFEALGLYVARGGKVDIRRLVEQVQPAASEAVRAGAIELALLGIRALELAREPDSLTSHDAWLAAIELSFAVAKYTLDEKARKDHGEVLRLARELAVAVADGNSPEALTSAANLVIELSPRSGKCPGNTKSDDNDHCSLEIDVKRATAILSGIASYSVTYVAAANANKSDAELRAAREQALEGVVDLVTQRAYRHGESVVGLGIPVGFSTGGQYLLNGPGMQPMWPQLQVPLGIAWQRLPGAHYSRGRGRGAALESCCKVKESNEWMFDGVHGMVTLIDLGQYAAYQSDGSPSQLRWDSLFSPGVQVGWAIGTPANSFLIAAEARYAPTLFSGTSDLTVREDELGGAIRFGISLSYYIPLVDFN